MTNEQTLIRAAELFRALSTASRLRILRALSDEPSSVSTLVATTKLSQPLVSQHLKWLRGNNLVTVTRSGRDARVVSDTIAHSREPRAARTADCSAKDSS